MANCLGWREKGVDLLGFMAVVQNITADLRLLPWYNPSYTTPCIKIRGRYSKLYTYSCGLQLFWWQCNHSLDLTVPESPKWQSNLKPKREKYTSLFKVTQYDFWIGGHQQLVPPSKVTHWNFKTGQSFRNMEDWTSFIASLDIVCCRKVGKGFWICKHLTCHFLPGPMQTSRQGRYQEPRRWRQKISFSSWRLADFLSLEWLPWLYFLSNI